MDTRFKKVLQTSIIGIIANVLLAGFKAVIGVLTNSIAITMDAVNNLTDAGSSLITIVGTKFAGKEPDKKHPFGFGRSEYLATLLIGGIIIYAGITSFVESVKKIIEPTTPDYSVVSLIIIGMAVLVKLLLGMYVQSVGKKINSDALIASGKDSLGDVAISGATLLTAILFVLTNLSIEAWLGAIIAIMIIKAGIEVLMETVSKILGEGADIELVKNIKKTIASHEEIRGAYDLILNNYGPDKYVASVHIEVNDTMTVNKLDELTRKVEDEIYNKFGVFLSAIGVYAINTQDEEAIKVREDIRKKVLEHPMVNQMHGFYLDKNEKQIRFDIVVSFDAKSRNAVLEDIMGTVKKDYPDYDISISTDSDFNEI